MQDQMAQMKLCLNLTPWRVMYVASRPKLVTLSSAKQTVLARFQSKEGK